MENTEKLLFGNDSSEWFVAHGEDWNGPFKSEEIYRQVGEGKLNWTNCIWKEGMEEWRPISSVSPFIEIFIQVQQKPQVLPSARTAKPKTPVKKEEKHIWFVRRDGVEYGPMKEGEVISLMSQQTLPASTVVWKEGFTEWKPLKDVFGDFVSVKSQEKRSFQRKPMVARVFATNDQVLSSGVCRDMSVGGMQVLTGELPGKPGDTVRLNVSLPENTKLKGSAVLTSGVIVRILEDGRGYSVRFLDVSDETKLEIEKYLDEVKS